MLIYIGTGSFIFADLRFIKTMANVKLFSICREQEGSSVISTTSNFIQFFPFPVTGLLRDSTIALRYKGQYGMVKGIIDSVDPSMVELTCRGCSTGKAENLEAIRKYSTRFSPLEN